jgi:hypothetical protein
MSVKTLVAMVMGLSVVMAVTGPAAAAEKALNVVVLTGGHDFDKAAFPKVFEGHADIQVTFADQKDHSEIFEDISDWKYDVIVFYNMSAKISVKRQENLLKLLDKGVGLVPLHHVLGAYPEWPEFSKIIGGRYLLKPQEWEGQQRPGSTYKEGIMLKMHVEADHPVTSGIQDFEIEDEGYKGQWHDSSAKLLLSCVNDASDKEIAWCKTYRNSRVCTIQAGHGPEAYANPNYRKLVYQAIRWVAEKGK